MKTLLERSKKGRFVKGFKYPKKWADKRVRPKGLKYKIKKENPTWFKKSFIPWSKNKNKKDFPQLSNSGVKKGTRPSPKTEFKKGRVPWNKNKLHLAIQRERHWNWQDGKSFEPYGLEFNEDLKEVIRNRDRRKCQISGKTELELGYKLSVHHIDYDKKNNDPKNLISLSKKWHTKTNYNRKYWIRFFKNYDKKTI